MVRQHRASGPASRTEYRHRFDLAFSFESQLNPDIELFEKLYGDLPVNNLNGAGQAGLCKRMDLRPDKRTPLRQKTRKKHSCPQHHIFNWPGTPYLRIAAPRQRGLDRRHSVTLYFHRLFGRLG